MTEEFFNANEAERVARYNSLINMIALHSPVAVNGTSGFAVDGMTGVSQPLREDSLVFKPL